MDDGCPTCDRALATREPLISINMQVGGGMSALINGLPPQSTAMKNVLAFFVTVFIGVVAGSCLLVADTIEAERKRRSVSASTQR